MNQAGAQNSGAETPRAAGFWDGLERYVRPYFRHALAVIFLWFGALKIVGESPVAELVARTLIALPPGPVVAVLGWWEIVIGVCFLFRRAVRLALVLLLVQLPGTFLPFFTAPERCYRGNPFLLTLEGEFIVKNLLLLGAAALIAGTLHPTPRAVSDPAIRK